ncbi:hypothetical protein KDD17_04045 [Sulfitobacter albidus]|uniref:Uncharacterized protein n=1 Tax=Sulfitobacter albidus TaxID=2829501 RepID=A0A975JF63_9RHOB|nr:hypothetical protein [Sulfitobacter albidus]QUJ77202.1 hypothetical protein KDD17_04045 [Sulfitobacter albidus]
MMTLFTLAALLGPQAIAVRRGWRVGGHLAVLLAGVTVVSVVWVVGTDAQPPRRGDGALTLLWLAIGALAMLVPLFLALQQMFPTYDYRLATVLAQGFALALAAAMIPRGALSGLPVFEGGALVLSIALFCVALHVVHRGELR